MSQEQISMSTLVEAKLPATDGREADVHGQRRIPRNVLSSWGGQFVLIISGFLMPRLIDRQLGQEELGIWDFAWSLISHFGLIQAGVTGSINRYVARFRAQGDITELNRAVSSVAGVLRIMGVLVVVLTAICVWAMPALLRASSTEHLAEARWLVSLLGASLAVQITASVYGGILTGCHRWEWHNGVHALTYSVMLGGMSAALLFGYGLIGLAAVNMGCETLGRIARLVLAYRACPGLAINRKHMRWKTAREMMGFGGKMFVRDCASLLLGQTVSLLIMTYLGPATLALFSRPVALVRTISTLISKYANVLTPIASSLHSAGEDSGIGQLAIRTSRYNALFTLPPTLFLTVLGGDVLGLWMGERYAMPSLIASLAGVYFFSIAYLPLYQVLCGTNQHGRASLIMLLGAIVGVGLGFIWLTRLHGNLLGLVFAFGLPWTLVNGIYLPIHGCRRLSIPLRKFLVGTWKEPLLCCLPFTLYLAAVHRHEFDSAWIKPVSGALGGGAILAACYWKFMLSETWKRRVTARLSFSRA